MAPYVNEISTKTIARDLGKGMVYFGSDVLGDISGACPEFGDVLTSQAIRLEAGSPDSEAATSTGVRVVSPAASRDVGEICSAFFSLNFASSPSTRFSRASSTSVFGPRFLGTASTSSRYSQSDMEQHCMGRRRQRVTQSTN
jgi:hypothetical protein